MAVRMWTSRENAPLGPVRVATEWGTKAWPTNADEIRYTRSPPRQPLPLTVTVPPRATLDGCTASRGVAALRDPASASAARPTAAMTLGKPLDRAGITSGYARRMNICPSCGSENPEGFRFCGSCGAPLAEALSAREVRKTVTILFCDVTGSTALGERLDSESLRRVMERYFTLAREVLERHGGRVEKFIGDAVMAVFGVPVVHEDDALRAARAAHELREELGGLNTDLRHEFGTELQVRMGVNTGEVVTSEGGTLATGDAVNVAARLEQAAEPGDILIGDATRQLAEGALELERIEPVDAKGKSEPLLAYRLLGVRADMPGFERRFDAPFVGREGELEQLVQAYARAVRDSSCQL